MVASLAFACINLCINVNSLTISVCLSYCLEVTDFVCLPLYSVPRYDQPPPVTYQPQQAERSQPLLVPANPYHTAEIPDWLQVYARAPVKWAFFFFPLHFTLCMPSLEGKQRNFDDWKENSSWYLFLNCVRTIADSAQGSCTRCSSY